MKCLVFRSGLQEIFVLFLLITYSDSSHELKLRLRFMLITNLVFLIVDVVLSDTVKKPSKSLGMRLSDVNKRHMSQVWVLQMKFWITHSSYWHLIFMKMFSILFLEKKKITRTCAEDAFVFVNVNQNIFILVNKKLKFTSFIKL